MMLISGGFIYFSAVQFIEWLFGRWKMRIARNGFIDSENGKLNLTAFMEHLTEFIVKFINYNPGVVHGG